MPRSPIAILAAALSPRRSWLPVCVGVVACHLGAPAQAQWNYHGPEGVVGVNASWPPGAATRGPHGVDLVLTGPNRHPYWQWLQSPGQYTMPADLSTVAATSAPSLVAGGRHPLDAFYRGRNGHLWTSWWDGTWWSAPADLGGVALGSAPTAVKGGPHRLDVFYLDTAGALRVSYWDGGAWWSAPGAFNVAGVKGPVAVVTSGPHKVEIFYRAANDRLGHFWSDGGPWSAPEAAPATMGAAISSSPAGASLVTPARTYASVYYRLSNGGKLCVLNSYNRHPWVNECTNIAVEDTLAAVTVDEVFFVRSKPTMPPAQPQPPGTLRIWRD